MSHCVPVSVWLRQYTIKVTKRSAFHPRMTNMSSDVKKERNHFPIFVYVCLDSGHLSDLVVG